MEDIQQSQLIFYLPITASYAAACLLGYFGLKKIVAPAQEENYRPAKPLQELLWALLAVTAIFGIGRVYSAGYLIPSDYNPLAWILNNLIIYSPIFLVLLLRKQPLSTIWIKAENWYWKIGVGLLASALSVSLFLLLRSEWRRWPAVVGKSLSLDGLSNFVAIFLEGVALAFLFVRLKWVTNLRVALAIPALLFALAHVPGMLSDGDPWWHMVLMSLATGAISLFVLYTCDRLKDIIWIGLVHYFLDAAISAF